MSSNEELLDLSKKLVEIQTDGKEHQAKEFFQIFGKIQRLIEPNLNKIPDDLKMSIGLAVVAAVSASSPEEQMQVIRGGMALLRTAVMLASGPSMAENLQKILSHEKAISDEMRKLEASEGEGDHVPIYDACWRATSYLTFMAYNGYGNVVPEGFRFSGKEANTP
jgi:hypothetical protein